MKKVIYMATTALSLVAISAPANAATIFSQNFSGGLNANESLFGNFSVNGGTVGHSGSYGNNEYSYYQLALDLSNVTASTLQLRFIANIENHFDRFNVLASTAGFAPPAGLFAPTNVGFYTDEGDIHNSNLGQVAFADGNPFDGTLSFDLGGFDGQTVNLRFQFGSDASVTRSGINMDDVLVQGNLVAGAVPEPATWAFMIFGFGAIGGAMRRQRKANVKVSYA